jgi:hypothetical protein
MSRVGIAVDIGVGVAADLVAAVSLVSGWFWPLATGTLLLPPGESR